MRETSKALSAYHAYVALGPGRSLAKLAETWGKSRAYVGQLERWSSAFGWVARASAHDAAAFAREQAEAEAAARQKSAEEREAQQKRRQEDEQAIREMFMRHINTGVSPTAATQIQAGKLLTEHYLIADEIVQLKEELAEIRRNLEKGPS